MNGKLLYLNQDKILFESPPCTRIVSINAAFGYQRIFLSFPYVQYFFRKVPLTKNRYASVNNGKIKAAFHVTISNKPMASMEDIVHVVPLPHAFDDASFCIRPNLSKCNTFAEMFEKTVEDFWLSRFSHSLSFLGCAAMEKVLKNYKSWEEKSKADPAFVLDVPWEYPMQLSKLPYRPYTITSHHNDYTT